MDNFTKQLLIVVAGIVVAISSVAFSISWYMTKTTTAAMENGYSMKAIPGSNSPQWFKY